MEYTLIKEWQFRPGRMLSADTKIDISNDLAERLSAEGYIGEVKKTKKTKTKRKKEKTKEKENNNN
tara:strand:+ start:3405 stop:3602 length:198 start_codon:yes stop_codon:yes gene_type:complete